MSMISADAPVTPIGAERCEKVGHGNATKFKGNSKRLHKVHIPFPGAEPLVKYQDYCGVNSNQQNVFNISGQQEVEKRKRTTIHSVVCEVARS
jgi:hypothetical protein